MSDLPPPPSAPPPSAPPPPPSSLIPPGYVAYGAPGARPYGGRFQAVGGIGKAMNILLIVFLPLQVLTVFSTYKLSNDAKDFLNGDMSESAFRSASRANLGTFSGLLLIPIAVLTMILMFRMAKNMQSVGRGGQTWRPGWAIGGWFCPPFLYVIPWLMFRELWKGSDPAASYDWKRSRVSPLVNLWWVMYGVIPLAGLVTAAGVFADLRRPTLEDFADKMHDFALINVLLGVVSFFAGIVYLLMIRQLVHRHRETIGEA